MTSVFKARLRSLPRHLKAEYLRRRPAPDLDRDPANPLAWIALARRRIAELPPGTQALLANHELRIGNRIATFFADDIRTNAGPALRQLAAVSPLSPDVIAQAVDQIVKWKAVAQSAYAHRAGRYFADSERFIQKQWRNTIWPVIKDCDFTHVLDLACGHGRNTELLRRHATTIDLVDINQSCIDACRRRFGERIENCAFRYHVTNGNSLAAIPTGAITLVYCWDSMVHFDKLVVRDYVAETARILTPGGHAFLHHSNLGAVAPDSDHLKNHGSRSNMSAGLMREFAAEAGLTVSFQRLSGRRDGWGLDDLDCLTLLGKT